MIAQERDNVIIFNLSSLNEQYPRLYLIPPIVVGNNNDYVFDVNYINWILYNDTVFVQFMNIISNLYNGKDIFLIISEEDWSCNLVDSLMKFIQERYGIVGVYVKTLDDLTYANDSDFSVPLGLMFVNEDMMRFGELTYRIRRDDNGNVIMGE